MLSDIFFRLRSLFRRNRVEAELDDELRFHFEQQVEKCIRSGMTREEARRQARLSVGGIDQVKEECREERGVHMENFASGSAIRLAHAGQEARIHDRGGADARSGSGGEYRHFQHRECRVVAFPALPRSRSFGTNLL